MKKILWFEVLLLIVLVFARNHVPVDWQLRIDCTLLGMVLLIAREIFGLVHSFRPYAGLLPRILKPWVLWGTIRVSISYLYRIEADGKFLFVKGSRIDQFQPVGGVIKVDEQGKRDLQELGMKVDTMFEADEDTATDLRIRIRGTKLLKLLKWFESRKGRECDYWREFQEELIATGILPAEAFPHVMSRFIRQHFNGLAFSKFAGRHELLLAEIVEFSPTPEQLECLMALLKEGDSEKYCWASAKQIENDKTIVLEGQEVAISPTCAWIV